MINVEKGIYKHFKGGLYEVLFTAIHSETEEEMVVYRSLSNNLVWVRPMSMWNEEVMYEGKKIKRFIKEKNKNNNNNNN